MCGDHLADAVGVDEADVEDKRNEMLVEDDWLEVEVEGNEYPGQEDRKEAVEGGFDRLVSLFADFHYVECTGCDISDGG